MTRVANFDDLKYLIEIGKAFSRETDLPFDSCATIKFLSEAMVAWDKLVLVVPGEVAIDGVIIAVSAPWPFAKNYLVAYELCMWVLPEARKKGVGKELIEGFKHWGRGIGADLIESGHLECLKDASKFYKHMGFEPYERMYRLKGI